MRLPVFAMLRLCAAVTAGVSALSSMSQAAPPSASVATVAILDVRMINDNEGLDPTSEAETARVQKLEAQVKALMEGSGKFKFIPVPAEMKEEIAKGQSIGDCGGCDIEFGKKLGADRIVWVTVQKISNLILNMNFYMADVQANKLAYLKSVDIRGNTDESWARSMKFLMDNYFLIDHPVSGASPSPMTQ